MGNIVIEIRKRYTSIMILFPFNKDYYNISEDNFGLKRGVFLFYLM
jgi:hypothetical protein